MMMRIDYEEYDHIIESLVEFWIYHTPFPIDEYACFCSQLEKALNDVLDELPEIIEIEL